MKLYAVRDKKTGKFWEYVEELDNYYLSDEYATAWQDWREMNTSDFLKKWGEKYNADMEYVTFREEPTEPCEWCKEGPEWLSNLTSYQVMKLKQWKLCPMCGRRLGDE